MDFSAIYYWSYQPIYKLQLMINNPVRKNLADNLPTPQMEKHDF